jgi:hypothetical protein
MSSFIVKPVDTSSAPESPVCPPETAERAANVSNHGHLVGRRSLRGKGAAGDEVRMTRQLPTFSAMPTRRTRVCTRWRIAGARATMPYGPPARRRGRVLRLGRRADPAAGSREVHSRGAVLHDLREGDGVREQLHLAREDLPQRARVLVQRERGVSCGVGRARTARHAPVCAGQRGPRRRAARADSRKVASSRRPRLDRARKRQLTRSFSAPAICV